VLVTSHHLSAANYRLFYRSGKPLASWWTQWFVVIFLFVQQAKKRRRLCDEVVMISIAYS
jgi:hypothetical protein